MPVAHGGSTGSVTRGTFPTATLKFAEAGLGNDSPVGVVNVYWTK